MTNIYGDGHRKAEAKDVGRRVEISNTGDFNTDEWCYLKAIGAKGRFICKHDKDFAFARVPILPGDERQFDTGKVSKEELLEMLKDPSKWVTLEELCSLPVHTIRRKLEAGGYAEAEQAVLIDGRYYALDWIKSGVGCLPEQCTID